MRIPPHEATSAQLGAAFPFVVERSLGAARVLIGDDAHGRAFTYDPFDLYALGALTSPNAVILGQVGRGKSALVKTFCYRELAFGRRVVVIDPKGEYAELAALAGGVPMRLAPGGEASVNPLDPAGLRTPRARVDAHVRLGAICEALAHRPLSAGEAAALTVAFETVSAGGTPTVAAVVAALCDPAPGALPGVGRDELRALGREPALALARLAGPEFGGVFGWAPNDAFGRSCVVVDVSAFYRSDALSVLALAVLGAVADAATVAPAPTIVVVDEAWAVLANPFASAFFQAFFKLARSVGVANVLVAHRLSDLDAAGPAARGLAAECETLVCYALHRDEADLVAGRFGLSDRAGALVPSLARGTGLWRVGTTTSVVRHRFSAAESRLVDTDARMRSGLAGVS